MLVGITYFIVAVIACGLTMKRAVQNSRIKRE
jgi:hypothetical protein